MMAKLADPAENPNLVALAEVVDVLGHDMGVPFAAVDRDSLHFSSAYPAARCLYLSPDTSVKSEWPVPARANQRSRTDSSAAPPRRRWAALVTHIDGDQFLGRRFELRSR
jgi:hypothetical protein